VAKKTVFRIPLRIVFYRERKVWIAHCLEFDLLGDGDTKEKALERLVEATSLQVEATLENNNPANLFSPADGKYFEMFAAGSNVAAGVLEFAMRELQSKSQSFMIEAIEAREFDDLNAELTPA
jgi:predicted RNase H-like HicB family nuclease